MTAVTVQNGQLMTIELWRVSIFAFGLVTIGVGYWQVGLRGTTNAIAEWFVRLLSIGSMLFMVFLWFNHVNYPLNLEVMESEVLQHVARLASSQFVYPSPSPEFIPLAYNPLYYVVSLPIVKVLGLGLPSLRFVAIMGMFGIGVMIFLVVQDHTRTTWWAIIAVGLFAAAYRVMDTYLDNAHSDSWFVFSALLGSYLVSRNRSFYWNAAGVVVLVLSFWFKQHGVIFVVGGLAFLLWRDGWKRTVGYGTIAAILGGAGYIIVGPLIFGPYFHFFTWQVPRQWSQVDVLTLFRYARFILVFYPGLAFVSVLDTIWTARSKYRRLTIWHFQLVGALLSGVMGSLDPGSNNNVYIPMGVWFILLGTISLYNIVKNVSAVKRHNLQALLFIGSFALFFYEPASVIVSPQADQSYHDFIAMLKGLNGQVYAPQIGQLQGDYTFVPGVHWVSLDDIVRGPGRDEENNPLTREILAKVIQPEKPAYILLPYPIASDSMLGFLSQYYVLDRDLGERFKPLSTLPKRFGNGWPRFLYRFDPDAAKAASTR